MPGTTQPKTYTRQVFDGYGSLTHSVVRMLTPAIRVKMKTVMALHFPIRPCSSGAPAYTCSLPFFRSSPRSSNAPRMAIEFTEP